MFEIMLRIKRAGVVDSSAAPFYFMKRMTKSGRIIAHLDLGERS
jgi:hypothetical protein